MLKGLNYLKPAGPEYELKHPIYFGCTSTSSCFIFLVPNHLDDEHTNKICHARQQEQKTHDVCGGKYFYSPESPSCPSACMPFIIDVQCNKCVMGSAKTRNSIAFADFSLR